MRNEREETLFKASTRNPTNDAAGTADALRDATRRLGFFFSSRRRHTRCSRDWSSDVCSSDLLALSAIVSGYAPLARDFGHPCGNKSRATAERTRGPERKAEFMRKILRRRIREIGRASCRERV